MAKKGKGKKGKKQDKEEPGVDVLTEVDKTFYELQITDLNRKLARLRELTANLEEKNTELEQKYVQLDEDRADVISYLKKQLREKQNEANELQERLFALQDAKDNEAVQFDNKVKEMDEEYRIMKEQLTSEIKLISGKLNALEEFRILRDDLMKKFIDQEKAIEEQEIKQKRTLYEAEKMYIMSKDTIKKDMEKRIIELAKDFQKANEIRIAATTHRVIRENIAINTEMDTLQEIIERLTKDNEELKLSNRTLKQNCDLLKEERNISLDKSKIHNGVTMQLKYKCKKLMEEVQAFKLEVRAARDKESDFKTSKKVISNLCHKVRILEQNLHAHKCETLAAKKLLRNAELKTQQLKNILFESVDAIEQSLRITLQDADESEKFSKREILLYYLLRLINEGHQEIIRCESTDTVDSVKEAYIRGDLGFVPKDTVEKKSSAVKFHMDTQVGPSLQDLQKPESAVPLVESAVTMAFISETIELEWDELSEELLSAEVSSSVFSEKKSKSKMLMEQSAYEITMSKIESLEGEIINVEQDITHEEENSTEGGDDEK